MANEDNTRQLNQSNGSNEEVLAAIRILSDKVATVEEVVLARLNDTRPFEKQLATQFNELTAKFNELMAKFNELSTVQLAMGEDLATLHEDLNQFRQETNHNFRLVNQKLGHLNDDFLHIRAEHTLLEKRVEQLEARAA